MSWLSRLLGFKDIVMPDVEKILKEDKKQTKEMFLDKKNAKGKDISEPVYAMLNAWKENPKRFVLTLDLSHKDLHTTSFYKSPYTKLSVWDSIGKEEFVFGLWLKSDSWRDISNILYHHMSWLYTHRIYPVLGSSVSYKSSWMTQDELYFIIETVKPYYLKRVNRYRDIVESRIDRTRKASELKSEIAKQKERDRLIGIYK